MVCGLLAREDEGSNWATECKCRLIGTSFTQHVTDTDIPPPSPSLPCHRCCVGGAAPSPELGVISSCCPLADIQSQPLSEAANPENSSGFSHRVGPPRRCSLEEIYGPEAATQ